MDFRAWIKSSGITQKKLAQDLGMSQSYLSEILSGKRKINTRLAQRIEDISGGEVNRMELLYPEDGTILKQETHTEMHMLIERGSPLTPEMREKVLSGEL
ncbi:MAG TPA: helix-turn-helix transcriptional regulator [Desulfomonilia bacterium]|jgi:transcriptional regulator with XRE-family HTH domain